MARKTFKKFITSEEKINSISKENKSLINLFIKDKSRKCSQETVRNYISDLNIFFCWVVDNLDNKYYPDIKKYEMSDFFTFAVDEMQWNGKRFSRMRSVLSGLSDTVIKYLDEEYPTFRNFVNTVIEPTSKEAVREKTVLSDDEIKKILDTLSHDGDYRGACLFALAIYSGGRISELGQYTIYSIDYNNLAYGDIMLETTHKIRCKGAGKVGKQLNRYIIKDLFVPYYIKYLEQRQNIKDKTDTKSEALFIKDNGKDATITTFRSWKNKWESIIENDVYFHALRHYYVTSLVKKGLSKDIIMAIIGWTSDMVDIYTDIEHKDRNWSKDISKLEELVGSGND